MQQIGIVRRLDDLGRVVIPKEYRQALGLREGDPIEMKCDVDGGILTAKKYVISGDEISDNLNKAKDSIEFSSYTEEQQIILSAMMKEVLTTVKDFESENSKEKRA